MLGGVLYAFVGKPRLGDGRVLTVSLLLSCVCSLTLLMFWGRRDCHLDPCGSLQKVKAAIFQSGPHTAQDGKPQRVVYLMQITVLLTLTRLPWVIRWPDQV